MAQVDVDLVTLVQAKTGKKSKYFTYNGVKFYPDAILLGVWDDVLELNLSTEQRQAWADTDDQTVEGAKPTGEIYTAGIIGGYNTMTKALKKAEFKGKLNKIEREYGMTTTQAAGAKAAADLV